jgi:cytidylate kinase
MQRDEQDARREHAPLRRAEDAIDIDSTGLSIEAVLEKMERIVNDKLEAQGSQAKGLLGAQR